MLNEAPFREIFDLITKKYAKVFEGAVDSDDDNAGWGSEEDED